MAQTDKRPRPAASRMAPAPAARGGASRRVPFPMTADGERFNLESMGPKMRQRLTAALSDPELIDQLGITSPRIVHTVAAAVEGKEPEPPKGFAASNVSYVDPLLQVVGALVVITDEALKAALPAPFARLVPAPETIAPYVIWYPDTRRELAPAVADYIDYKWPGLSQLATPEAKLAMAIFAACKNNAMRFHERQKAQQPPAAPAPPNP